MMWLEDGGLSIDPPKKLKKITGTRFASILGLNEWHTPFEMWCDITHTYTEPFEGSIYTEAGKVIEPKQIEYMERYFDKVYTPTLMYGYDYFKFTHGDFFAEDKIFGGMWDALGYDDDKLKAVIECKTTKRVEDWVDDVPEYYSLQAALYAWLLKVDDVYMICSVLEDSDYADPNKYEVNSKNTFVKHFKVSEKYPNFIDLMVKAKFFYEDYCVTGISPIPTDKDKDIVKALHTSHITADDKEEDLIAELIELKNEIDENKSKVADAEKRYKLISDALKTAYDSRVKAGEYVEIGSNGYTLKFSPTVTETVDKAKLKADGFEKYIKTTTSCRMTLTKEKEN